MSSARRPGLAAALALALTVTSGACSSPPNQNACDSIVEVGSMAHPIGMLSPDGRMWRTADPYDPNAPRIDFRAYTTYRLWHGLGHEPFTAPVILAGFPASVILAPQVGNTGELLPSCGGEAGVASEFVLIRNAGGEDFQVIVTLE